jgi:hypothetical protein
MTATPGISGKGKHQQAARKQDAEFAHELFPCSWRRGPLQSGGVANPKPRIDVTGSACWSMPIEACHLHNEVGLSVAKRSAWGLPSGVALARGFLTIWNPYLADG